VNQLCASCSRPGAKVTFVDLGVLVAAGGVQSITAPTKQAPQVQDRRHGARGGRGARSAGPRAERGRAVRRQDRLLNRNCGANPSTTATATAPIIAVATGHPIGSFGGRRSATATPTGPAYRVAAART
jgi:hypothetical protein